MTYWHSELERSSEYLKKLHMAGREPGLLLLRYIAFCKAKVARYEKNNPRRQA